MNKEEIEEIETLEIDFKDTDELELALEVSSKKAIYLIDDLIKHLFELQQENKELQQKVNQLETNIDEAIELLSKGITFCENDSQGNYDICNIAINREKKAIEILERGK